METNPLEDIVVAKGTTLGNPQAPLYVLQSAIRTYVASDMHGCIRMMNERADFTSINAAGPASVQFREQLTILFDSIGFFS